MKRQYPIEIMSCIRFLAVPLMVAGMLLNSACAVAQDPIPFHAMMQSAGAQTPVPQRLDATGQQAYRSHTTKAGKTEIGVGFFLLGTGIAVIATTAFFGSKGLKPGGAKSPALYAGGAAAAGVGATLITLGFHRRSRK